MKNVGLNASINCSCGAPKSALTNWCIDCWKALSPVEKYKVINALERMRDIMREAEVSLEVPRRFRTMTKVHEDDD